MLIALVMLVSIPAYLLGAFAAQALGLSDDLAFVVGLCAASGAGYAVVVPFGSRNR